MRGGAYGNTSTEKLPTPALRSLEQVPDRNAVLCPVGAKASLITAGLKQEAKQNRRCVP